MRRTVSLWARKISPRCSAEDHGRAWPPLGGRRRRAQARPARRRSERATARGTWSGIVVTWPIEGEDQPLPIEMSGLPIFGRDHEFAGYRGFGICRDVDRLTALEQRRAQATSAPAEAKVETPADNVQAPAEEPPALSAGERSAFEELARELSARLKGASGKSTVAPLPANVARAPAAPVRRTVRGGDAARDVHEGRPILDRMPVGILVYRRNTLLYANRAFRLDRLSLAGGAFRSRRPRQPVHRHQERGSRRRRPNRRQIADHQYRQRRSEAGRRPPDQRALERRERVGADDQHACGGRGPQQAHDARRLEIENDELKSILDTATTA